MPKFLVELNDGRKFQVEANRQPTPEEAIQLLGGGEQPALSDKPYLSQLGEALSTGYGQMTSGVGATFNALTGDTPDVAANLAEMGRLQREQQASRTAEDIALTQDFARSKAAYEQAQGPLETIEALGGYLGATARNPGAAFKQAVQSAPNALISGVTGLAGYGLGGLLGAGAGIETGPGAILTGIAGAAAGGAVSNTLMEAGPAIYNILNERTGGAAANMTADEITAYLNENPDLMSEGLKTGAIRGSVIGLVEGLGLKGAGALSTIPERAAARAVQKTLVDAGVDVSSKEAVEAAVKNPAIFAAVKQAGETAKQQFSSAGNLARMGGAAGIEIGASGAGEAGAQMATGREVDPTEVYQEMLGEVGLSLPMALGSKIIDSRKYLSPTDGVTGMPPPLESQIAAEALNATTDTPFTDISGQAAADTIAQNTELAMRMPVQPVEAAEEIAPEVTPSLPEAGPPVVDNEAPAGTPVQAAPIQSLEKAMLAKEQRESIGGTTGAWKDVSNDEPPVPKGFVRFYHAGDPVISKGDRRWLSPDRSWVTGFRPGLPVSFVDIPVSDPQLKKSFDDSGTPMSSPFVNFEADEQTTAKLQPLSAGLQAAIPQQLVETQEDAIQEQIPDEGVLRQEGPEMELQGMGEQNVQPEEVAGEVVQEEVTPADTRLAILREMRELGALPDKEIKSTLSKDPEKLNRILSVLPPVGAKKAIPYVIKQARSAYENQASLSEAPATFEVSDDLAKAKVGGTTVGQASTVKADAETAQRMFPEQVKPGEDVRRVQAIDLATSQRGKGVGKQLYVAAMSQNPGAWYYNSQATKEAARALRSLERYGLIELHVKQERDGEFGPHIKRLTPEGMAFARTFLPQAPQTKQAAETQTPESTATDSGAAGVVQSEPSRGSILEVEKESTKTAIESTGKSAPSGYGEVVNSARKSLKERPADFKAQEQVLSDLMKLPVADLQSAFEVVTGSPTKLANKRQLANNVLNELLAEAQESKPTAAEDTFRKAERESEEEIQRQNAQSISNLFDKLRTNPQAGQVTRVDVNQAIGALQNSGEVPNAIFTWSGTTDDLLRQRATMERQFPGAVAAASMPNVEGVFENGMAFVFSNRVVVTDLDRRKAAEEGISPSVAAVKRVVTHENMHKGLWLLSPKQQSDIMSFLRQMFPAAELDELAKSYRQYADWRTNPVHEMALLDERLQKYIEETKTIPTDGVWKQFWDYIKEIWRKLTGNSKGEPTLQSMKDVVRLIRSALKNAHKARPDRTIDGGRVLMSVSGGRSFVPAVNIDGRVEIGASHYDAWIKHALRQIPNFKKDGLSDEERRQLADRWIVDHPEFMAYSLRKEGFVSDGEFLNRQDSLKKFKSLGGVQQMAPGEPDRDWLDASDVEGYRFSYASEQDEASSIGQQTARYAASSPRTIEAIVGVRQAYASMPKSNGAAVMLDDLFVETAKLVPNFTRPEFDRVIQGMYDDNAVLLNDAQNPSSVTILPGAMMSMATNEEEKSAAAKFKSAITAAAKGLPDLREYEGRLVKAASGEAIDVEPHNVLWFDGFMKASEQLLSDLQKQGLSLQQIYDKVAMDTEFKRELGLFDEETGSGQAATVLSGLLLQRTLNDTRKARTAEAKAQGDALHRKAAAYYSTLATARGQNLLMYRLLQNDPRTRFAFMEDKVTNEMLKKAEHGVNVQFGDGYAATQEAVNDAVDASSEAAKTEVADAVENAAEEDQDAIDLAEGEATLDAKGKTLWEKFKDLIRKRGIAIRALNAIRSAKNARQSIAKSERDSISQMSEEELVKFIAGLDSEMETVFKQFVGGSDETTRKKREKMVKTAKKRAEKGQDIDVKPTDASKIINQVRRDIKTPSGKPIQWREIFRQPGKTVQEYRQNIFNAVNSNEAFIDLDETQKRRLSELFAEAWQAQRDKILDSMIEQHTYSLERQQKKEAAKALRDARNQIIEAVNLGAFSNDELTRVLGEKFGFKTSFTEDEKQKLSDLAEKLQDEKLNKAKRNKLAREFLSTLQSGAQIPIAELLSNWWVSAVLSGGNTVSAIALSFLNGTGIGIMGTHLSRALRELMKGNTANAIDAVTSLFKAYAKHISSFPTAANRAWQYLWSGDVSFLESSANDPFGRVNTLADIAKYQVVADQVAKDPNKVKAVMGRFMQFMGRLLTALDAFNVMVTKAGTVSLAIRQSGLTPEQIRDAELKNDLKFYKDKIVREDPHFGGKQPTSAKEKAYLSSLAEAEMYADLAEMGVKMENADYLASESAMTMNPTGVGGIVYNAIKALDAKVTEETRKHLQMAEIAWSKNKTTENATILFAWRAINFAAEQGLNAFGLRFARFAGNKFNQSSSFVPVLGLLRMIEADNKELSGRQEAFKDTIIRNQSIGAILMFAGWAIIKAIEEEPDDEKRGWFLNGGWNNLTPDQKKQKLSKGEKQYTLGIGDYVFNYQNWPISQPLAALGELSDLIRYSQDKWKAKTAGGKAGSAVISGMQAALEIPALTQVGEIFGNTMAAKDPAEQTVSRLSRVTAGWMGGFMPRILKDLDYMQDPTMRRYETLFQKVASHVPVYRRYVGSDYYDILGNKIEKNAIPGSRDFMKLEDKPEYRMLGALNARGIWLTPTNAEYRMVGKGRFRRRLTQEEADRYSLETGKLYRQMVMNYGPRALQMPVERAKDYISAKADDMRDLALQRAIRN